MADSKLIDVRSRVEKWRWGLFAFFVLVAPGSLYGLAWLGADHFLQWAGFGLCALAAVGLFVTSLLAKRLRVFFEDSIKETQKMVWPDRAYVIQLTIAVILVFLVIALFLWLSDKVLEWALYELLLGWKR
jgi:preprotein translocase subunit SecE